jgi:hypothetical protein
MINACSYTAPGFLLPSCNGFILFISRHTRPQNLVAGGTRECLGNHSAPAGSRSGHRRSWRSCPAAM